MAAMVKAPPTIDIGSRSLTRPCLEQSLAQFEWAEEIRLRIAVANWIVLGFNARQGGNDIAGPTRGNAFDVPAGELFTGLPIRVRTGLPMPWPGLWILTLEPVFQLDGPDHLAIRLPAELHGRTTVNGSTK
jgi:hypothetical protein